MRPLCIGKGTKLITQNFCKPTLSKYQKSAYVDEENG